MSQAPDNDLLEMAWEQGFYATREGFNGECEIDDLGREEVFDDGIEWVVEDLAGVGPTHLAIRAQSLHMLRTRSGGKEE